MMVIYIVGVVYEGVNKLPNGFRSRHSPPWPSRGGRDINKMPRSLLVGADLVV
jgi:hypothetical protein